MHRVAADGHGGRSWDGGGRELDTEATGPSTRRGVARGRETDGNRASWPSLAALLLAGAGTAEAQIRIGAILSISGPGAAMGVGYKGAFDFLPTEIAGQKIEYIIRDDGTDAQTAYKIAQKLITEDHVDAIIGPSLYSSDIAVQPLASDAHVPMIAMAPLVPETAKFPYSFAVAQPLSLMVSVVFGDMRAHGVKTVGFIGFSDGWGDQVHAATVQAAAAAGIRIVADERYARADTTVQAQALRLMSLHPDAVMMGNSATPAVLPVAALRRLGYRGAHLRQSRHRLARLHPRRRRGGRWRGGGHQPGRGL